MRRRARSRWRSDDNFDLAEVLLQLALVLGSVAILALNRPILILAGRARRARHCADR